MRIQSIEHRQCLLTTPQVVANVQAGGTTAPWAPRS
jgi:hypothetical protein